MIRDAQAEWLQQQPFASWQDASNVFQSRRWHRVTFDEPVALTPLNPRTFAPIGRQTLVRGRNISCEAAGDSLIPDDGLLRSTPVNRRESPVSACWGGISFSHLNPMPYTIVALTFGSSKKEGCHNSIMTRLTWCRFCRDQRFLSGGRFLEAMDLDLDNGIDWGQLPAA